MVASEAAGPKTGFQIGKAEMGKLRFHTAQLGSRQQRLNHVLNQQPGLVESHPVGTDEKVADERLLIIVKEKTVAFDAVLVNQGVAREALFFQAVRDQAR
ncbi:MAG: hypothetical protein DMG24_15040 [Acidobacteria bacterium]|nr:MAG: hypothetical protein DMG24_15040 [Acidobacteriota bacterium]